jgi:enamine deaminase RidA (YjgF/YER057c/UK114 family)
MTEKLQRSAIQPNNPLLNASPRISNLPHVPGIRVGDYIFLSGMVPVDPQTGERSHGPIAEQVRVTLSNMQHMLESAGSSLERVLRACMWCSLTSRTWRKWIGFIVTFFGSTRPPARLGRCSFGSAMAARSSAWRWQAEWSQPACALIGI